MKKKKITIQITQQDILDGRARDCERCPVARAANRALALKVNHVHVSSTYLYTADGKLWAKLPKRICKFIKRFDSGCTDKPPAKFTLTLRRK